MMLIQILLQAGIFTGTFIGIFTGTFIGILAGTFIGILAGTFIGILKKYDYYYQYTLHN